MPRFYYITRLMVKVMLFIFTRRQITGRENIPNKGPLLVVANHLSLADPPLLNVTLNRDVVFMAKAKLFRFRFMDYFFRGLGAFPVRQGQPDTRAIHQAEQILAQGSMLIIFPEGMRSRKASLQRPFLGPALVTLRCGAPVLPVGITGTEKLENPLKMLGRPRITVKIGRPFYLPPVSGKLTRTQVNESSHYIMERVAELLPVKYQGIYARRIRWH